MNDKNHDCDKCPICGGTLFPAEHFENEWCCLECGKSFNEKGDYIPDGDFD